MYFGRKGRILKMDIESSKILASKSFIDSRRKGRILKMDIESHVASLLCYTTTTKKKRKNPENGY